MNNNEKRFVYIEKKDQKTSSNIKSQPSNTTLNLPIYGSLSNWAIVPDYYLVYNVSYNTNVDTINIKIFDTEIELPFKSIIESETGITIKNNNFEITSTYEPITKKLSITVNLTKNDK